MTNAFSRYVTSSSIMKESSEKVEQPFFAFLLIFKLQSIEKNIDRFVIDKKNTKMLV